MLPAIVSASSLLRANTVSAFGTAAPVLARRIGLLAPPWQIIARIASEQSLALAQQLTLHTSNGDAMSPKTATA